jgi:glutathione peroxidase
LGMCFLDTSPHPVLYITYLQPGDVLYIESIYDIDICSSDGKITRLDDYRGHIIMVVNMATECGFNDQLIEMEQTYQQFKDQQVVILGFPSDQFNQEPLDDDELSITYEKKFEVSFPLFRKTLVNGPHAHPLFQYLCKRLPGVFGTESIKWNFTKFIIDRNGTPLKRFSPITHIQSVNDYLEILLQEEKAA